MTFAQVPQSAYGFEPAPDIVARRLGEFTCVVHAGAHMRETTAQSLEQLAATAAVDGYRDFVFDLTRVGRYETPALRSVADLWRRLSGLDCEVFVADSYAAIGGGDPDGLPWFADGARSAHIVDAVVASARAGAAWVDV